MAHSDAPACGRHARTAFALYVGKTTDPGVVSTTKALSRMQGMATRSIQDFFDAHDASNPSLSRILFSRRRAVRASSAAVRNAPPQKVFHSRNRTTDSVMRAAITTYNKRFVRTALRAAEQAKR